MNCQGLKPLLCLMGRNENKEQVIGRTGQGWPHLSVLERQQPTFCLRGAAGGAGWAGEA